MRTRGFTIVELIITITIMGILLTLAAVGLATTQVKARDDERKSDVSAIQAYLETYYRSGTPATGSVPIITNYAANPSAAGASVDKFGFAGTPVSTTRTIASDRSHLGPTSLKVVSTGTGQMGSSARTPTGTSMRVATNETLYWSLWLYSTKAGAITPWADASKVSDGTYTGCGATSTSIPANVWVRITASCVPSVDFYLNQAGVYGLSVVSGDTVWFDEFMITKNSPALPGYADGDSAGWIWDGTANSATSSGPAVPLGIPGTYPNTTLATSSLLSLYLPDTDMKVFTAPGSASASATFISATNNAQSPTGVTPQPTVGQYVYQPIDSGGGLCSANDCRKYNIYYRLEGDNTVYMVRSKNQ